MFFVRLMMDQRCLHYWRTTQLPGVRDFVCVKDEVYLIRSRFWRQASGLLPEYSSQLSFVESPDEMVVVDLICETSDFLGIREGV